MEPLGFSVVREFVGHGIGRKLHEAPQLPNYGEAGQGPRRKAGMTLAIELNSEQQQVYFGEKLAGLLSKAAVVFLEGELGAGKTTLVRGILRGLGWRGNVKSPTYTIVEPYELGGVNLYHFDLYRLADPEELEYLGLREMLGHGMLFFEWPERGRGFLPEPDCVIHISHSREGRELAIDAGDRELRQRLETMLQGS